MKSQKYSLVRYDADEGKAFDWKEPRYTEDENGNKVQDHLYAKTLFIGHTDSITNYIEVDNQENAAELSEPDLVTADEA